MIIKIQDFPGVPDKEVSAIVFFGEYPYHLREVPDSINGDLPEFQGLKCGLQRQDTTFEALLDGQLDYRERSGNAPHCPVKPQFPHNEILIQRWKHFLPRGSNDPQGNRHVKSASAPKKRRISSRTLKRWAKNVWSVSPWVVIGVAFLFVLFVVIHLPRKENTEVDRDTPVINYLVLSWDETGKYGTRTKAHGADGSVIEFRVPYGVYDVLNNNSIPVELTIGTDKNAVKPSPSPSASPSPSTSPSPSASPSSSPTASASPSPSPEASPDMSSDTSADASQAPASNPSSAPDGTGSGSAEVVAAELSAPAAPADTEEEDGPVKITMRPNSKRTITIDTNQYLTLSEDANDLILFYVSEVPEEKDSDVTGHDNGDSGRVVYAYVKGTEVRFRKSPSLEGAIIDSMQNGQQVQVLGVTGEWTHVAVQNEKGYIFSQFLTSEDPTAAAFEAKKAEEAARQSMNAPTVEASSEPAADASSGDTVPAQVQTAPADSAASVQTDSAAGDPAAPQ